MQQARDGQEGVGKRSHNTHDWYRTRVTTDATWPPVSQTKAHAAMKTKRCGEESPSPRYVTRAGGSTPQQMPRRTDRLALPTAV